MTKPSAYLDKVTLNELEALSILYRRCYSWHKDQGRRWEGLGACNDIKKSMIAICGKDGKKADRDKLQVRDILTLHAGGKNPHVDKNSDLGKAYRSIAVFYNGLAPRLDDTNYFHPSLYSVQYMINLLDSVDKESGMALLGAMEQLTKAGVATKESIESWAMGKLLFVLDGSYGLLINRGVQLLAARPMHEKSKTYSQFRASENVNMPLLLWVSGEYAKLVGSPLIGDGFRPPPKVWSTERKELVEVTPVAKEAKNVVPTAQISVNVEEPEDDSEDTPDTGVCQESDAPVRRVQLSMKSDYNKLSEELEKSRQRVIDLHSRNARVNEANKALAAANIGLKETSEDLQRQLNKALDEQYVVGKREPPEDYNKLKSAYAEYQELLKANKQLEQELDRVREELRTAERKYEGLKIVGAKMLEERVKTLNTHSQELSETNKKLEQELAEARKTADSVNDNNYWLDVLRGVVSLGGDPSRTVDVLKKLLDSY